VLVGDAYNGYASIERRSGGRILHASCNVHARREFIAAEKIEPILSESDHDNRGASDHDR
jgi:hypothetical protein